MCELLNAYITVVEGLVVLVVGLVIVAVLVSGGVCLAVCVMVDCIGGGDEWRTH